MRIYLAGPMRGYENFNFAAFDFAAAKLREQGHEVFSPAEADRLKDPNIEFNKAGDEDEAAKTTGFTIRDAMLTDTAWICQNADAVALLPGWGQSKGANAEFALAVAIGLTTIELGKAYTP